MSKGRCQLECCGGGGGGGGGGVEVDGLAEVEGPASPCSV